jgi:hypothetical protein
MFKFNKTAGLSAVLASILLLTACSPSSNSTPTPNAQQIYTQAAETVQAQLTQVLGLTPSATPTPPPTETQPPIPTQAPTQSSLSTQPSAILPSITVPAVADKGNWISNDPPDKTKLNPGDQFTLTWKVQNTGLTTWSTKYTVRFYTGQRMGAKDFFLPKSVKPNDIIDIPVQMTAPSQKGEYNTLWVITNEQGVNFRPLSFEFSVQGDASTVTATPESSTRTPTPEDDSGTPTDTETPES